MVRQNWTEDEQRLDSMGFEEWLECTLFWLASPPAGLSNKSHWLAAERAHGVLLARITHFEVRTQPPQVALEQDPAILLMKRLVNKFLKDIKRFKQ
jgi:hypothetical protein